jgi:hypothetical protein
MLSVHNTILKSAGTHCESCGYQSNPVGLGTCKDFMSIEDFMTHLNKLSNISYIDFGLLCIDDTYLPIIYTWLKRNSDSLIIIDLSHNFFTKVSFDIIQKILKFPKLQWLDLTGGCFALRNIKTLAVLLNDLSLINKVIFCEKHYTNYGKTKVSLYAHLVEKGYLSPDWDQHHHNYYDAIDKL